MRVRTSDERGLIGKLIVAWLVVAALILLLLLDAGSILLARWRAADLAQDAAFAAAESYAASGDEVQARAVAKTTIVEADPDARLKRFEIASGEVTVVVVDRAGTLILGRLGITRDLAKVTVTDTARPSG